ncbi:MAG: sigma-70 family RNA polymerase sigma factor [Clostridia bacterium]|nr:sigma-70 family RNA polymerase sigma factor [Clostridia bacterium]
MINATNPATDSEAWLRCIIHTYEKDLLRLCCVYLRDVSLAEDAVQETFLKAYRNRNAFRGESSLKTWLVRIAVNVCKDMRKSRWFRMMKNSVTLDQLQIAQEDTPIIIHSELIAAITNLPHKEKEVILLRYYENLNQSEIADVLALSHATVHRRLVKACKRLRNELEGGTVYES